MQVKPHQSSVPTGQHSVSQLSAEVNLLTAGLFPKIQVVEPRLAGKITGMLLEMDNTELLVLLSEQRALMNKINEALAVLKDHQQKQSQQNHGSIQNPSTQNSALTLSQSYSPMQNKPTIVCQCDQFKWHFKDSVQLM